MRKFKDKNDYLNYLSKKFPYEQMKLMVMNQLNKDEFNPIKMKLYFFTKANADERVLNYINDELSNELFDHINAYGLDLDYIDIFHIISTKKEIDYHKKENMSCDGSESKREIKKLKKDADRIQKLSTDSEIKIRLPQLPHKSLFMLIEYFRARNILTEESIKDISLFFRKRLPRSGNLKSERFVDLNDLIGGKIIEEMMNGTDIDIINDNILNDDFKPQKEINELEFYIPKLN